MVENKMQTERLNDTHEKVGKKRDRKKRKGGKGKKKIIFHPNIYGFTSKICFTINPAQIRNIIIILD